VNYITTQTFVKNCGRLSVIPLKVSRIEQLIDIT